MLCSRPTGHGVEAPLATRRVAPGSCQVPARVLWPYCIPRRGLQATLRRCRRPRRTVERVAISEAYHGCGKFAGPRALCHASPRNAMTPCITLKLSYGRKLRYKHCVPSHWPLLTTLTRMNRPSRVTRITNFLKHVFFLSLEPSGQLCAERAHGQ